MEGEKSLDIYPSNGSLTNPSKGNLGNPFGPELQVYYLSILFVALKHKWDDGGDFSGPKNSNCRSGASKGTTLNHKTIFRLALVLDMFCL